MIHYKWKSVIVLLVMSFAIGLSDTFQYTKAAINEIGEPVPVLARFDFAPPGGNTRSIDIIDTGGQGYHGIIQYPVAGAEHYAESQRNDGDGYALWLPGGKWSNAATASLGNADTDSGDHLINKADQRITLSAWVKVNGEFFQYNPVIGKKNNGGVVSPFALGIYGGLLIPDNENNADPEEPSPPDEEKGKCLYFEGGNESGKYRFYSDPIELELDEWAHIAVVFEKGKGLQFYFNGESVGSVDGSEVPYGLSQNIVNLQLGRDWFEMWSPYQGKDSNRQYRLGGMIDSVRIYACALDADQIVMDMDGTLQMRQAVESDVSKYQTMALDMYLVRYDMPIGFQERANDNGRTRQAAERLTGEGVEDAVDWPEITLYQYWDEERTDVIYPFNDSSSKSLGIVQADAGVIRQHFQQSSDHVIFPGNHWFRGILGRYSRLEIQTSDRTARTGNSGYELWTFPVIIEGQSAGDVKNVVLRYKGEEIYNTGDFEYNTLTLLLPQNEAGIQYELSVNGSTFSFDVGLEPVTPGNPRDILIDLNQRSGIYTVKNLNRPQSFPNQAEWDADIAALTLPKPQPLEYTRDTSTIKSHLGIDVPRSPVEINFIALPHGMTGGSYNYKTGSHVTEYNILGSPEKYADYLADTGYDRVYEQTLKSSMNDAADPKSYDNLAVALSRRGIKFGTVPGGMFWNVPYAQHPNIPFFTHNLPHYRAPLYRMIQLEAQRLGKYNFTGINIGADNAGYESFWSWAPNMIDTPWGEAYLNFNNDKNFKIPLIPNTSAVPKDFEFKPANFREFLDTISVYDETFKEYEYFYDAVASVDPDNIATTGSFGSSPGVLGRGGYKIGTFPGDIIFSGLPVQQAYDWNELSSSKPMHNIALIDRLRSYDPDKPTWTIIDDFDLSVMERDSRQKAYALALTRGIQAIGPNYIPNDIGGLARPETIAEQKELYDWIHKYGGTYSMANPDAPIGIMYVTEQALSRNTMQDVTPPDGQLLKGSHEGKVTEALFFTHAAGYPSKVITPQELKRGLPESMKTILLVGLRKVDDSWVWYEGLDDELQAFIDKGGRILLDYESICPVSATETGIQSYSYVPQRNEDWTNELLARNEENIAKLRDAMASTEKPAAFSASETVWAIPTMSGNTQYVTVVNQKHDGQTNHLIGQIGSIKWNTSRPIYDVRSGRKIDPAEAEAVDLTADAFQYYALPQEEVTTPSVIIEKGPSGFYEADVSIAGTVELTGIPVEITVTHEETGDSATVYSATGLTAVLPLTDDDNEGVYNVTVTELLSGLDTTATVEIVRSTMDNKNENESQLSVDRENNIRSFAGRTAVPLTIALTPEQNDDPEIRAEAERLADYYTGEGRDVQFGIVEPNGIVLSLQTYALTARYPQWTTVDTDLVLFGNSSNNVLLLDQARGYLLPEQGGNFKKGYAAVSYVNSPFVGERDVINIIADDAEGIARAADYIVDPAASSAPAVPVLGLAPDDKAKIMIANYEESYAEDAAIYGELQYQIITEGAGGESGKWIRYDAATGISGNPVTLYSIRVRYGGNENYNPGTSSEAASITTGKLTQAPPAVEYIREGDWETEGVTVTIIRPTTGASYSTDDFATTVANPICFPAGTTSAAIYVRLDETDTHKQSETTKIEISFLKQDQPVPEITYDTSSDESSIILMVDASGGLTGSYEYRIDDDTAYTDLPEDGKILLKTPGKVISLFVRARGDFEYNPGSDATAVIPLPKYKNSVTVTMTEANFSVTDTSITMISAPEATSGSALEYNFDGGPYVSLDRDNLPGFTGLLPKSSHTISVRAAEDETYEAGAAATVILSTTYTPPNDDEDEDEDDKDDGDDDNTGSLSGTGSATTDVNGSTITPRSAASNGTTIAKLSAASVKKALANARSAAKAVGEAPEIIVSAPAKANTDTVAVTIPKTAFEEIEKSPDTRLTIEAGDVSLTFSDEALSAIGRNAGGDVVITAGRTDASKLTDEQKKTVQGRPVYSLSVTCGDTAYMSFEGSAEVSLPYTLKPGEDPNAVVIYYVDGKGNLQIVENSVYDPATGRVTFTTIHFSEYMIGYNPVEFSDVKENHWGRPAIEFAAARNLVSGTGSRKYEPDREITRAEFVQMVQNVLKLPEVASEAEYSDVAADKWHYRAVMALKSAGLLKGIEGADDSFRPDQVITREEMAVILANAAVYRKVDIPTDEIDLTERFKDYEFVGEDYRDEVQIIVKLGLMNGMGAGVFAPEGGTARAQAAQVQMNLLKVL